MSQTSSAAVLPASTTTQRPAIPDNRCPAHAIVSAFIASRVDYCNAVLYGVSARVTRRLQMVLIAAARHVVGTGKHDHITPALRDVLHWLPVPQRTEFKIAVLAFDCVRGTGPAYFKDVCVPVSDIAARSSLRLAESGDLFVSRTRTMKLSRRSFTVAAPVIWNSLPAHLRSLLISRGQFRHNVVCLPLYSDTRRT